VTSDPFDDQYGRTLLSWRRTALSLVAVGVLVAHLSARSIGSALVVGTLTCTTAVIAFVWLGHGRQVGAAGLGLVLGVLLLGAIALAGIAALGS
jgi:hypothetical protein